jgi:hypothetical protein
LHDAVGPAHAAQLTILRDRALEAFKHGLIHGSVFDGGADADDGSSGQAFLERSKRYVGV